MSVVFCEKYRLPVGSDKGKLPYWGIKEINLPTDRKTENDAGLSISSTSVIKENGFSDVARVTFNLTRGNAKQISINWESLFGAIADVIPTSTTVVNWAQIISDLFKTIPNVVEEGEVESQDETLEWVLSVSTNPEKLSDVNLQLSPDSDHKTLDELSYKKVDTFGTWVTYEGDMENANKEFINIAKSRLNIS
jgi:hypothetical protein